MLPYLSLSLRNFPVTLEKGRRLACPKCLIGLNITTYKRPLLEGVTRNLFQSGLAMPTLQHESLWRQLKERPGRRVLGDGFPTNSFLKLWYPVFAIEH